MSRQYRFQSWMLNSHPGNVTDAVKRVIVRAHNAGLVVTSTTDGAHAPTSYHYKGGAVDLGELDGSPGDKVRFQRWLAARPGHFLEVFGPDNAANVKDGRVIQLAEGAPLETNHDSHVHVAPRPDNPLPPLPLPQAVKDRQLATRLWRKHKVRYGLRIIQEARKAGVPTALALALVEQESGFRNVWGGDPAPNGGTTGWRLRPVKRADYLAYRQRRGPRGHGGMQGVGPAQLTWYSYQDEADREGGAWTVTANLRVGFRVLARNVKTHGLRAGVRSYNGSGPAAERYATEVLAKYDKWADRLAAL